MAKSKLSPQQRQLADEALAYLRMLRSLYKAQAVRFDNPHVQKIAAAVEGLHRLMVKNDEAKRPTTRG
jgi:hypothetical protein